MSTTIRFRWHNPPLPWLAALLLVLTGITAQPAQSAGKQLSITDAFIAHFDVGRGRMGLGTARFALAAGTRAGCYVYTGRAVPNALASLFVGKIRDESRFCIDDGVLRPQHFSHHVDGKPKKSYTLLFDWAAQRVRYRSETGKQKTMTLPARALDPLSIHIAAQRWVDAAADAATHGEADFPLAVKAEIKTYRLRATDGGVVETPAGRFDTILVERVDSGKRQLRFWLARGAGWMPVRVEQQSDDDGIFRMNLTSLSRRP